MPYYKIQDATLTSIANAIRGKTGSQELIDVSDFASEIGDISVGTDVLALMTGSETFNLDNATFPTTATEIPQYMFYGNTNIRNINISGIKTIGQYAFSNSSINKIVLPDCETISDYAFNATSNGGTNYTDNSFPEVKTIGSYAFSGSRVSGTLSFPKCTTIAENAFRAMGGSGSGVTFDLPMVESIGANGLGFNSITSDIELPSIITLGNQVFRGWNVHNVKLGSSCTSIGSNLFYSATCVNLYVYATVPPTLGGNIDSNGTVTNIFVPAGSVEDYKTANRWSNSASKIQAIPTSE